MFGAETQTTATVLVTAGAVAFALAVFLWAFRLTAGVRNAHHRWRDRAAGYETSLERADAILAAHPGIVMVWEEDLPDTEHDWGEPRLLGSPATLAALLRFADASDGPEPAARILDGLADFEARDAAGEETTLRARLGQLREEGRPFSLTITGPAGRFLEADGRPAGRRAVLWLTDSTIKGLEESRARGRLEEARQEIEQDPIAFLDMLARAPFPVWRMSSGLKLQWCNAAYLEAVEIEALSEAVAEDVALDDAVRDQTRRALSTGMRMDETRALIAAGQRRHFAVSVFPVSGGAAGIAIDMTRAHEAREALERHVSAQDDVLNSLEDAVAIFSPQQELTFNNRALETLFSLERSWLDSRPTHGALLDHLRDRRLLPEQDDYPTWRREELASYTDVELDEPGSDTWHMPNDRTVRVTRLRHPGGGLLLIFSEMTDELTLESQYNTLIKVQAATLDKLREAVVVFSTDGRLRLSSEAFREIWRLQPELVSDGTPFDDVANACLPTFHDRKVWSDLKARVTDIDPQVRRPTEGEMRCSDGRIFTYSTWPLPDGATAIAFSDITAARNLESALNARAEALEDAARVKSEFVGHVSYQLRAPIQTIMGFAELLESTAGPTLDNKDAERLGSILEAGGHLSKLVDDILDIAAIDAHTFELEMGPLDLRATLESAVNLVRTTTADSKTRVRLDAPVDLGPIRGDEQRIKQVIYNLVLNAVRHSGGAEEVVVGADRDGDAAQIWVEDDGAGIPPEKVARVFDRFYAGDHSNGAGLGLTLVRELIEMHGGWVDLQSELGQGTRVTCHLPGGDAAGNREAAE